MICRLIDTQLVVRNIFFNSICEYKSLDPVPCHLIRKWDGKSHWVRQFNKMRISRTIIENKPFSWFIHIGSMQLNFWQFVCVYDKTVSMILAFPIQCRIEIVRVCVCVCVEEFLAFKLSKMPFDTLNMRVQWRLRHQ